jgi:hypothetical protein
VVCISVALCNFTAHIKQSLPVHIQNHPLSPEKARSARHLNKVSASDEIAEAAMDADELELLRLEREADEDGSLNKNEYQRIAEEMMDLDYDSTLNWSEPKANLTFNLSAFFKAKASMEHEFRRNDC